MTALLLGCGGASDVGEVDQGAPTAVAKVLNHPFTAQDGNATVHVRSGTELRLSGKDSKGRGVPVLTWTWSAANAAAEGIPLVERNSSTVNLTVPGIAGELLFRLRVEDGNGAADDALVTVIVEEALDPDAFLTYAGDDNYTLVAVTSAATPLTSDVPFRVTIEHLLDYSDVEGIAHTDFLVATRTQTVSGRWLQSDGTGGPACGDARNPRFALPLPSLIMDDVLKNIGPDQPELAVDPARIDDAVLHLRMTITPEAPLPPGVQAGLCVLDANGQRALAGGTTGASSFTTAADGVSSLADVPLDALLGAATRVRDTRASALAYYRTIDDPEDEIAKRLFSGWLAQAGFAEGTTDWQAMRAALQSSATGAHAVYLNNFDLGFGRDMYLRLGACDDATPASLAGATLGACDVYGVVINYGSLEAAARNLQPIVAVAMEYTRAPGSVGNRITKFYTYAPNRSGDFDRVLSIDLDGRGEKFMPGVCTVCHGGTPRGLDARDPTRYGNGGDVDGAFLPWDLDSLLYSDTDPAFSHSGDPDFPPSEQQLAAAFTRAAQEPQFKRLNQLAWLTYAGTVRSALARDLVEGWYGGAGFPNPAFDGRYVPAGWRAETEGNPALAPSIYLDVFARNCRSCHVMHVPGPSGTGQFAISSYADFVGAVNLTTQLESGRMPLARLTMDRFWLPTPGAPDEPPAAERLSQHFRDDANEATAEFGRPGPVARIDGLGAEGATLVRGADYSLDGRRSTTQATTGYAWRLEAPPGSLARLRFADSAAPTLVGVDLKGEYRISLSVGGRGPVSCDQALADGTAATSCTTRVRRDSVPIADTIRGQPLGVTVALDAGATTQLALGVRWDSAGDGTIALESAAAAANGAGIAAAPCGDGMTVCVSVPAGAVTSEPVRVDAVIVDADQDKDSVAASFAVFVAQGLTVRPCVREVPVRPNNAAAYPQQIVDISDCVAGAGVRGVRFLDAAGNEISGGRLPYLPPAGRMSVFVSAPPETIRRPVSADSELVAFTVEYADAGAAEPPQSGSVEIRLVGVDDADWSDAAGPGDAVSFARLHAALLQPTGCGGCHSRPDSPIGFLGIDAADGYGRMRCGVDGRDPLATPYVLTATPESSALVLKPHGELNHGGRALDLRGDPVLRATVLPGTLQWIEQGAYDTERVGVSGCP
jgi:mono/diheme cytochrome c family protein